MILPDVNVLVYAFRREAQQHDRYSAWLQSVVDGADELALHDTPLAGFVRVVSNARIFAKPAPTGRALEFVERLVGAPRSRWIVPSSTSWDKFASLLHDDAAVTGNGVPDALLASLALTHGCRLATADRGFARFPGLTFFDPALE